MVQVAVPLRVCGIGLLYSQLVSGLTFENGYTNEGCGAVADEYVGSMAVLNSMDVCVIA